jgi:hypothetical protein
MVRSRGHTERDAARPAARGPRARLAEGTAKAEREMDNARPSQSVPERPPAEPTRNAALATGVGLLRGGADGLTRPPLYQDCSDRKARGMPSPDHDLRSCSVGPLQA